MTASSVVTPAAPPGPMEVHDQVAAQVLAGLRDHDFDAVESRFDPEMKRAVPKAKVDRVWSSVIATRGELLSWKLVERGSSSGFDELRFALAHEHGESEALFSFSRDGREVAGLLIRPKVSR